MAKAKLYFEDIQEGQEVPTFERTTDFMNWNRYAAVNDEFVYLHMDDEAGKVSGYGAAIGMGNLRFAYLHDMLRQWIGDSGDIKELGVQYRRENLKNDRLVSWGKVEKKYTKDGEHLVELSVGVRNQKGEESTPGKAVVALPSRRG